MRAGLIALLLSVALPATADIGRSTLACDAVTAAPDCVAASQIWDFEPTGGITVLHDRLRLAGIETRNGATRLVILDLSLPDGEILSIIPLVGDVPMSSATEFSADGSVLLVVPNLDWSSITDDSLPPQTMLAFDAWGKSVGWADGLAVTAMTGAFGENRLRLAKGRVEMDLFTTGDPGLVFVDLATGAVEDGPITDGEWLYAYVFERDRGWYQDGVVAQSRFSRDGAPSSVMLQTGASDPVVLMGGVPGVYDREFAQPVLSPDGRGLAVMQMADGAPGPILLAMSVPEGKEVWRAVIAEAKDRPALYRWSATGALVTVQPHPDLEGVNTIVVYQPGA